MTMTLTDFLNQAEKQEGSGTHQVVAGAKPIARATFWLTARAIGTFATIGLTARLHVPSLTERRWYNMLHCFLLLLREK